MKFVFIDTEYTGQHAFTTLISVGLVTLDGKELYFALDDYDKNQVTNWIKENVLSQININKIISRPEALNKTENFFNNYSKGEKIALVSAGKITDLNLFFQLWHTKYPDQKYFNALNNIPAYLNHRYHLDLDTLFFAAGIDPNIIRENYIDSSSISGNKHDALYDAKVVRECFVKLMKEKTFNHIDLQIKI